MELHREDLIQQLIEKHRYTKTAARSVVDDFADIIIDNMRAGNTVVINGFGKFDLLSRKARNGAHPVTKERIDIPAHYIPRFYPFKQMRLAVKMWEDDKKRGMI